MSAPGSVIPFGLFVWRITGDLSDELLGAG
jgi:hypothetical protein